MMFAQPQFDFAATLPCGHYVAGAVENPVFIRCWKKAVYRVRADEHPESPLSVYWFSLRADNTQAVDVRTLPGWTEPAEAVHPAHLQHLVGRLVRQKLAADHRRLVDAEAERVIRAALARGLFLPQQ